MFVNETKMISLSVNYITVTKNIVNDNYNEDYTSAHSSLFSLYKIRSAISTNMGTPCIYAAERIHCSKPVEVLGKHSCCICRQFRLASFYRSTK